MAAATQRFLVVIVATAILAAGCDDPRSRKSVSRPSGCVVSGVDVSRHQGTIDWRAVAGSGSSFVWIKATEGGDHLDSEFRRNWVLASASGLRRGAYHFIYWCRRAEDQAAWFIANVPADPDALPPVLDVEWNPASKSCPGKVGKAKAVADMTIILAAMERAYGRKPLIYAPFDIYRDVVEGEFPTYPMWLRSLSGPPGEPYGGRSWIVWQHTETGRVPGISGPVDQDCFSGGRSAWKAWVLGQGQTPPPETPH